METSQQLYSDSFSYRWLMTIKSSHDELDDIHLSFGTQDAGSFIDMDPGFISLRWTSDFDFDLPRSESSVLVHADQIFSNGLLLPLHCTTVSKYAVASKFCSSPTRPATSSSSPLFHSAKGTPCPASFSSTGWKLKIHFVKNCLKSSKKTLCRYLCFVIPLCKKVKCLRLSSSKSMRSCKDSVGSSLRASNSFSNMEWCRNDADISIYDAILHCKKSIGQDGD